MHVYHWVMPANALHPYLAVFVLPLNDRSISLFLKWFRTAQMWQQNKSTSSSSWDSVSGPFRVSWKRIFFIFRYWRLSSSRTASFVLCMRSISTLGGRSRRTKSCYNQGNKTHGLRHDISMFHVKTRAQVLLPPKRGMRHEFTFIS